MDEDEEEVVKRKLEDTKYKGRAWDAPTVEAALMDTSTALPATPASTFASVTSMKQKNIIDAYGSRIRLENAEKKHEDLKKEMDELRKEMKMKAWADNLAHARAREELDFLNNSKNEYRLIINGLSSQLSKPPAMGPERTEWIKEVVKRLANAVAPGSGENVQHIRQLTSEDRDFPAAEVIFDRAENALRVRRGFIEKKKAGMDFGKIFLANKVTLATRVRIELLLAIARQFGSEEQKIYVKQFTARPVIVIKNSDSANYGKEYALTFVDAMARFGLGLDEANLAQAYWKTGSAFHDQLEQTFVILNEPGRQRSIKKRDNWEVTSNGRGGGGRQGGVRGGMRRGGWRGGGGKGRGGRGGGGSY